MRKNEILQTKIITEECYTTIMQVYFEELLNKYDNIVKMINNTKKDVILESSFLQILLAKAYYKNGKISNSIELCLKILKKYNKIYECWMILSLCYIRQNKLNDALIAINNSLVIRPLNSISLAIKANIFYKKNELQEALNYYIYASVVRPQNNSYKEKIIIIKHKNNNLINFLEKYEKSEIVDMLLKNVSNIQIELTHLNNIKL